MKKTSAAVIAVLLAATMTACSKTPAASSGAGTVQSATQSVSQSASAALPAASASEPTASANQSAAASGSQAQTEKAAYHENNLAPPVLVSKVLFCSSLKINSLSNIDLLIG